MVAHRHYLRFLIILSVIIFFGSVQCSDEQKNKPNIDINSFQPVAALGYWEWFKKFFYEGYYPSDITIPIDGKEESHRRVSDVIITTVLVMGTVKLLWPIIDHIGDRIEGIVEDYLPNVWLIKDFKDQKKKKREQEIIDTIIADREREEKWKKIMEHANATDFKDWMKNQTNKK